MAVARPISTFVVAGLSILLGASLMIPSEAAPAHPHAAELKNTDGSWKYTNHLINETSPYLLQHAHNPVDWYPWGKQAFKEAKKQDKPIFLSIGYSTCYWCHVMERLVFENPTIAAQMNQEFINIKVDREERPDVDDIYMAATQMITRSGGWPMSVFLTPPGASGPDDAGLKPFWAGTYVPPEPKFGRPGFPQILEGLSRAWKQQRDQVLAQADQITNAIKQHLSQRDSGGQLAAETVQEAANQLMQAYDIDDGGFGNAPKFPQPDKLQLLFRVYQNNPRDDIWQAADYTLQRMAHGGMYDQIGGGFHRYSTDAKWLVPHFEKMLYDNGQLVEAYCTAHTIKPHEDNPEFYPRIVRSICDYVLREMTDESGTFWSAQDAEVDAREGQNYVWIETQVRQAIHDDQLADLALAMYGLEQGTNFQDPHHPDEPRTNILFLSKPLHELARQRDLTLENLLISKAEIDRQMMAVRDKRKQPGTDDKVLVSWNGLMIAGFAMAARTLNEDRYTSAAKRAADYILTHMRTENDGLYRTMRKGQVKILAFLEDYAFFVHGLLELHRTTQQSRWLDDARALTTLAQQLFAAKNHGYHDTLANQADLFVRSRTVYDGAIPSGNSQMIHNLIDLYELTNHPEYLDQAVSDLQSFAGALQKNGSNMSHMQHALLRAIEIAPLRFVKVKPRVTEKQSGPITISLDTTTLDLSRGPATARLAMTIAEGYHTNSHTPNMKNLIPTRLELIGAEGLQLDVEYPVGKNHRYEAIMDQDLSVYVGSVTFEVTVSKTQNTDRPRRPMFVLHYQACTESACLLPAKIELPITISGID